MEYGVLRLALGEKKLGTLQNMGCGGKGYLKSGLSQECGTPGRGGCNRAWVAKDSEETLGRGDRQRVAVCLLPKLT